MIQSDQPLPVTRRCELLKVARSTAYCRPGPVSHEDVVLMRLIDEIHLELPFYGSRRIRDELETRGHPVNRKRVQRLMRHMGVAALYPKRRTSAPGRGQKVYPYLLTGVSVERANQVWATDICDLPMAQGFMSLVAVMDWLSRRVLSWRVSNTLDREFCVEALEEALARYGAPEIFNTDQGAQFTSEAFTDVLKAHGVAISMDGKGRWIDNVFIERLWRSVKDEDIYLRAYETPAALRAGLTRVLRLLQHPAPSYGTGPTHPGCGALRAGRGEHGGLKPGGDFTEDTVHDPGSTSVATRQSARSLEPLGADVTTRGTSKSAVSRRCVAQTQAQLDAWRATPLDALDLVGLLIDGVHVEGHCIVVALGIDTMGAKHPLGLWEGATENATVCQGLLTNLGSRGLRTDRSLLVIVDGAKALDTAVTQPFGRAALVQRCQVHKGRNILEHLPEAQRPWVKVVLTRAYTNSHVKTAKRLLQDLARRLDTDYPSAATSVREGLDETLTVLGLGLSERLQRSLATTNAIESLLSRTRHVQRHVKRWRGGTMVLRWVAAGVLEAAKGFRRVQGCQEMPALVAALRARDARLGLGESSEMVASS